MAPHLEEPSTIDLQAPPREGPELVAPEPGTSL